MRSGDYPIGSQRSRAAARSLLHFRSRAEAEVRRFTLIMDRGDVTEPSFSPWKSGEDGGLYRVASIPKGALLQQKRSERKLSSALGTRIAAIEAEMIKTGSCLERSAFRTGWRWWTDCGQSAATQSQF
jgi:hypothetical protein